MTPAYKKFFTGVVIGVYTAGSCILYESLRLEQICTNNKVVIREKRKNYDNDSVYSKKLN